MNDDVSVFLLSSVEADAPAPVLTGTEARGRLHGVLFEMTLRQTYRNASLRNLEVVYTFPLANDAVLLGFGSELNGVREQGRIVAKADAERRYEASLADGDAPVMLETSSKGVHTANIGNLKPGDHLVLEVRYAQLLRFEQGRLRVAVPTTFAPRYGSPAAAGLQPQQVPGASLEAEHKLTLSVDVMAPFDTSRVECPTHEMDRRAIEGGVRLSLQGCAWLDRDLVVLVQSLEDQPSLLVHANDMRSETAPFVAMAALRPRASDVELAVSVKVLVDCSGSMAGDSMTSAREALRGLMARFIPNDYVSLTRFGSTVHHVLPLACCSPATLTAASVEIGRTEASMGGTEMEAALKAVFGLKGPKQEEGADVLLITDGQVWESSEVAAAAKSSGHRVFAIGVGSAAAEGVLREVASATGGACEFVTPGEALEAAAHRMLVRIRQPRWGSTRVEWGAPPVWESKLPTSIFGGDTVFVFAGFAAKPSGQTVRLMIRDATGTKFEVARSEASAPCDADTLSRMAAFRRLDGASELVAQQLAVQYQLMTSAVNCILVHERSDAEKAVESAELHRVTSMLAAGWGATGTVRETRNGSLRYSLAPSAFSSAAEAFPGFPVDGLFGADLETDTLVRPCMSAPGEGRSAATLRELSSAIGEHLRLGRPRVDIADVCARMGVHPEVRRAVVQLLALGLDAGSAWLLLAYWVNGRLGNEGISDGQTLLRLKVDVLSEEQKVEGIKDLEVTLGRFDLDGWPASRQARLARAIEGMGR